VYLKMISLRKFLKKRLLKIDYFEKFYNSGYMGVGFSILIINFIFQRILRMSSTANFSVNFKSTVLQGDRIVFGDFTLKSFALSPGLYIQGGNGIQFGKNVLIGPNVSIISSNHDFVNRHEWVKTSPITIGDDVWIGASATILPGVQLGDSVIVGAGSVVTKSFKKNSIIAGNPAKVIRILKSSERTNDSKH
jgi:acetyltransferase-like isoleucine patch superfamily enzyme